MPAQDKQALLESITGPNSELSSAGRSSDLSQLEGMRTPIFTQSPNNGPAFEELRQEQRNLEYMQDPRSGFMDSVDGLAPFMRKNVFGSEMSGEEHMSATQTKIKQMKSKIGIRDGKNGMEYKDSKSRKTVNSLLQEGGYKKFDNAEDMIFPFKIGPARKDGNRRKDLASMLDPDTGKYVVVPLGFQFGWYGGVEKANGEEALEFAKGIGVDKFPVFDTREQGRDFIEEIQGNLNDDSTLKK